MGCCSKSIWICINMWWEIVWVIIANPIRTVKVQREWEIEKHYSYVPLYVLWQQFNHIQYEIIKPSQDHNLEHSLDFDRE